ncbi:MAG: hypothetical protein AB8B58_06275, partial [Roseobacter sp.]
MRITIPALLVSTALLAGCGSAANPMNWFGNDAPDEAVLDPIDATTNPLIPESDGIFSNNRDRSEIYRGTTIDAIADLTVERVPGGLLIRATGRAATQGA